MPGEKRRRRRGVAKPCDGCGTCGATGAAIEHGVVFVGYGPSVLGWRCERCHRRVSYAGAVLDPGGWREIYKADGVRVMAAEGYEAGKVNGNTEHGHAPKAEPEVPWRTWKQPEERAVQVARAVWLSVATDQAANECEALEAIAAEYMVERVAELEQAGDENARRILESLHAMDEQGWRCLLCSTSKGLTLYPIFPEGKGGRWERDFLAVLCPQCVDDSDVYRREVGVNVAAQILLEQRVRMVELTMSHGGWRPKTRVLRIGPNALGTRTRPAPAAHEPVSLTT